ncbi:unnamed protein product [Hydatigera taeniaeformis]|uniref:C2H2-type domain-containing protein n=1 Tax=Hydatigena taeniaeformis TaxID=6205 RepID=A0A0R3WNL1_HYDTA|nr:unnamed protein product [Hydatigera taeniaeformis]
MPPSALHLPLVHPAAAFASPLTNAAEQADISGSIHKTHDDRQFVTLVVHSEKPQTGLCDAPQFARRMARFQSMEDCNTCDSIMSASPRLVVHLDDARPLASSSSSDFGCVDYGEDQLPKETSFGLRGLKMQHCEAKHEMHDVELSRTDSKVGVCRISRRGHTLQDAELHGRLPGGGPIVEANPLWQPFHRRTDADSTN